MTESATPPPTEPGWTLLARGEQGSDAINRCPAGHIHLDYGNFGVRFHRDEYLAFVRMVDEAAAHLTGGQWPAPPLVEFKPATTFSRN